MNVVFLCVNKVGKKERNGFIPYMKTSAPSREGRRYLHKICPSVLFLSHL